MTNETCTVDLEVCLFTSILQIPVIVNALYHERNPQYSSEAQDLPWHIFQSKDEACGSHPWLYIWITCKVFVSVVSTVVSTLLFQCWVSTVVSTLLFQYWWLDLIPGKVGSNKKKKKENVSPCFWGRSVIFNIPELKPGWWSIRLLLLFSC